MNRFPKSAAPSIVFLQLRLGLMLSVVSFAALTMPGCGGCSCNRSDDPESDVENESEDDSEEEDEAKKDFEIVQRPNILPYDENSRLRPAKPGHWVQTVQEIRTNNFDYYADLQTESRDKNQEPLGLDGSNYHIRQSRPAAFAKGEAKQVRSTYFIPKLEHRERQQAWLGFQLQSRKSGREMLADTELTSRMPGFQYYFVVLAKSPVRYGFVKRLHAIAPPKSEYSLDGTSPHYRVVLPQLDDGAVPLPDHALAWTSIAYILWDELDPERLSPEQQTALLDWLHWGGQIIIDGPGSLDMLRNSFLSDHLPANKVGTLELQQSDFDEFNTDWSQSQSVALQKSTRNVDLSGETLLGIELERAADADYLPGTGKLVVERQVGRGRIVVSAFPLASRPFTSWTHCDGFFNACLMRRPSRLFEVADGYMLPEVLWPGYEDLNDARLTSTLRYFTRDAGPAANQPTSARDSLTSTAIGLEGDPGLRRTPRNELETSDTWHFGGYEADATSGVAGWSDFNGAAQAARSSLKDAAGISTPSPRFVLSVLAAYLIVLVPMNWAFFRLIGRVEWAWIAAPLIAIVGTVVVVRSAQLDIGFVRSRTEVAVLELHGGYSRGHLTRFSALYSSLSTTYEATLDDHNAQALPFGKDRDGGKREGLNVIDVRQEHVKTLDGYKVRSNSTGILRSEQMYNLDGPIKLVEGSSGWRIVNASGLALRDVGVLRRDQQGNAEVAWVGQLAGDGTAVLRFATPDGNHVRLRQWNDSPIAFSIDQQVRLLLTEKDANGDGRLDRDELRDQPRLLQHFQRSDISTRRETVESRGSDGYLDRNELVHCCRLAREGELRLGRFFDLASEQLQIGSGEVRLVGWSDQQLGGVTIRPEASQTTFRTFVIVHLRPAKPLPAVPDHNHYLDVAVENPYE